MTGTDDDTGHVEPKLTAASEVSLSPKALVDEILALDRRILRVIVLGPSGEVKAAKDSELGPKLTIPEASDMTKFAAGIVSSWKAADGGSKYLGPQTYDVTAYRDTKVLLMQLPDGKGLLVVRLPREVNGEAYYQKITSFLAMQPVQGAKDAPSIENATQARTAQAQAEVSAETEALSSRKPMVVACIPCFNEAESIASVVIEAQKHADLVLVCDDGSTDMTGEIAEKLGAVVIRHEENRGKGVAMADLLIDARELGAKVVITLDGDGQHNPDEMPKLVQPILDGTADVVIGSRSIGDGMPGHRKLGNRALNAVTNMGSSLRLTDTQSGYRALSRNALETLQVRDSGLGLESQMIMDADRAGLRVSEVPVQVIYGDKTSTYGSARHGAYVLGTVLRTVAERSPLMYLGIPGFAFIVASFIPGLALLNLYNTTKYWSLPLTIVALALFFMGVILIVAALLLYSINNLEVRLRHSR